MRWSRSKKRKTEQTEREQTYEGGRSAGDREQL